MTGSIWVPLAASLVACAVTAAGIVAVRSFRERAERHSGYFVCFAAGVLIAVSVLHIVPKAGEMTESAPYLILGGYLLMHALDRFLTAYVCDRTDHADATLGLVPLIGIGLHSLLDGVVYAVSFTVSAFTGVLVAIGMVLHEFPEGVVTYTLLRAGGIPSRRALLLALAAAAFTTPLGVLASYPFVSRIGAPLLGGLLALSAGMLIYVGATHLLPQALREQGRYSVTALLAGVAVAIGIAISGG
ncbi:ZIP family metal transporter [Minwuia thermotolerans]|uniref:ZIP family metal transporter n=1 Tax=Minwuia thermotolerans TaxID=2056226 RepID=A0A2M9G6G3_9PROT|nr:ZIP family metal transporter [Minwuia thermotolerans]PJK31309.1 ZIP family metal transporter [Minwuia thermotolerans]